MQEFIKKSQDLERLVQEQEHSQYHKEMKDVLKIDKSLKSLDQTSGNERKQQRGGFAGMLLGTLCASLLGDILTGKSVIRAEDGVTGTCKDF